MTRDHMGAGREKEPAYAGPPWMFRASYSTEDQEKSDLGSGYVTKYFGIPSSHKGSLEIFY
jgi:hypothetical protein